MKYDHSPIRTAAFYGFLPRNGAKKNSTSKNKEKIENKKDQNKAQLLSSEIVPHRGLSFDDLLQDKISLIRHYMEKKFSSMPQPVTVYDNKSHGHLSLDILGNSKSIADAMLLETAFAVLSDEYKEGELLLELNSIGDRESISRFTRESNNYYKKHWADVPKDLKPIFKKNIFSVFQEKSKELKELQENGPKSIGSLSESSRRHFKEVLEYIEGLKIPYIINHDLIGSPSWMSEVIMRISLVNESGSTVKTLACGGRYNGLAKKVFGKKDIPACGAEVVLKAALKEGTKLNYKLFFIQLSFEAKIKSLQIMEILRKANIPVYQSLSKDKLTSQIGQAEKMKVPYILLMGKKEAIENSVVVRNTTTRCQETVPVDNLVKYLKQTI